MARATKVWGLPSAAPLGVALSVWGYRPVYPHGSTWAVLDKVAQLARTARMDLRTARRVVQGK
jgi:hypothetical protein